METYSIVNDTLHHIFNQLNVCRNSCISTRAFAVVTVHSTAADQTDGHAILDEWTAAVALLVHENTEYLIDLNFHLIVYNNN